VLAVTAPVGAAVTVLAALAAGAAGLGGDGFGGTDGLAWATAAGVAGAAGLIVFYAGFVAAPMSVVAPVAALISTLLPLGVAIAQGERPGLPVVAGGLICLSAVVLVSVAPAAPGRRTAAERMRGLGYGAAAGVLFGLFFLFFREAGTTAVLGPVVIVRLAGTAVALGAAAVTRIRPVGPGAGRGVLAMALVSGAADAAANLCYVLATRAGMFGLVVVITSLYPGITVLLARVLLGERIRWMQRIGLVLAALGVVLVTA
jgi:uncharacterized membrane protein